MFWLYARHLFAVLLTEGFPWLSYTSVEHIAYEHWASKICPLRKKHDRNVKLQDIILNIQNDIKHEQAKSNIRDPFYAAMAPFVWTTRSGIPSRSKWARRLIKWKPWSKRGPFSLHSLMPQGWQPDNHSSINFILFIILYGTMFWQTFCANSANRKDYYASNFLETMKFWPGRRSTSLTSIISVYEFMDASSVDWLSHINCFKIMILFLTLCSGT